MGIQNTKVTLELGQLVATPGIIDLVNRQDCYSAIQRHASGDWGEVCEEDKAVNNEALIEGDRILSSYTDRNGVTFWIITEHDRSVTTILLPCEY